MMHDFFAEHPLLLAPMAGVTDEAFRALCREQGASLAYTEMVSAKGLSFANEKTRHLLRLAPGEDLVAVQLFGHEPAVMAEQAAWIEHTMGDTLAYLDINMGCPARKIVTKGDGSALMCDPVLAASIVSAVRDAVKHPVTVKFRRGFKIGEETAPEFARRMEAAGACAVTVHGRFSEQLYRGSADWDVIAKVKRSVAIPVVGNGDVRCGADAVALREKTDCDAIMIGRGAEGNPWVFAQVKAALAGEEGPLGPALPSVLPWRAAMRTCSPSGRGATSCGCANTQCGTWRAFPGQRPRAGRSTPALRRKISTRCSTSCSPLQQHTIARTTQRRAPS